MKLYVHWAGASAEFEVSTLQHQVWLTASACLIVCACLRDHG